MPYIDIDYCNCRFTMREISDGTADARAQQGESPQHISDEILEAYYTHIKQDMVFQALIKMINDKANKQ